MESDYLYMEREFLTGAVDAPKGESFLEREKVSYGEYTFFNILWASHFIEYKSADKSAINCIFLFLYFALSSLCDI